MRANGLALFYVVALGCSGARTTPDRETPVATAKAVEPERAVVTADALGDILPDAGYVVPAQDTTFAANAPWHTRVADAVEEFSVAGQPPGCAVVTWAVDGPKAMPTNGKGTALRVTFSAPGVYRVTARCGKETAERVVVLCDYAARIDAAANYYGEANDFSLVTLDWTGTISDASWTAHNHVAVGDGVLRASLGCPDVTHFVHEFGHVWEYQHGQNQLALGARDQIKNLFSDQYDYGGADGVRAAVRDAKPIEKFNLEQQAEIFAHDYYMKAQGWTSQYAQDLATLTKPALAQRPVAVKAEQQIEH